MHNPIFFRFLLLGFLCFSVLCCVEDDPSTPNIRIIINESFRGEIESAHRIRIACQNLGWNAVLSDITELENDAKLYDINLTIVPNKAALSNQTDYLIIFDPIHHFFSADGHLQEIYNAYSGYLVIYENKDRLLEDLEGHSVRIFNKPWYPTVQYRPYQIVSPDHLFFVVSAWGNRRYDPKYCTLQTLLAKKKYSAFYGHPETGQAYRNAFKGDIAFDGISLIERISEAGVCLVLHSDTHLKYKIPSGRIFEAASASAVIICDRNQFVIDHFGDAVLYIDEKLPATKIFKQINKHMQWIQTHKAEALEMARKAHQIFEENFLLENQLLDLKAYHESLKNEG